MTLDQNRRQFERFSLQPMYTEVKVQRVVEGSMQELAGHAYDISEGGIRIDLDEALDVGEHVNVSVNLPDHSSLAPQQLNASCQAVWVNDEEDDPAMPRQALRVIRYFDEGERQRLLRYLGGGVAHRVA